MTQEALKELLEAVEEAIQAGDWKVDGACDPDLVIRRSKEALAQEQEPVAWVSEDVCEGQYINGRPRKIWWECEEGVGTAFYTAPPQRTERPVDCERCNRLEEQAYDLVGKLRVANIKLSMQPQRTWVDLTDEDISEIVRGTHNTGSFVRAIEAKLKEKNT